MKKNWQKEKGDLKKKMSNYHIGYRQLISIYYDNVRTVNKD